MSNVSGSKPRFEKIQEWEIPLRDGKCTVRDVSDLLRVAENTLRTTLEAQGKSADAIERVLSYDDAFYVETDGERLFVTFRTPVPPADGGLVR